MEKIKKNAVLIIGVLSQILLTLFVIYWLVGEYNTERRLLHQELRRGFISAERIMIDSILATHLINPILRDSNYTSIQLSFVADSFNDNLSDKRITIIKPKRIKDNHGMTELIKMNNQNSTLQNDTSVVQLRSYTGTINTNLYRGVRMFINRYGRLDHNEFGRGTFISANADSVILQKAFLNILQQDHPEFEAYWSSKYEDVNNSQNGIVLLSSIFENTLSVHVSKFHLFLLAAISPQILFAFILLLMTFVSFRISHISLKKQKRLLYIKNEFISNITHELKTPVATVKVALEALLDFDMKKDPKVVQDYLEMSLLEMNRLDLLVSQVLNNSVLENGNKLFTKEDTNLDLLIEEVIKPLQYRVSKNDASINYTPALGEVSSLVDKIHLQGVLINLIDNSLKYGGEKVQIELGLKQHGNQIEISVKDNGPGIPKEYIEKVFDKFFRVPTGDRHNVKGYGLGLNYSKLVMQHHEGTISVRNFSEGGCEFLLTFPIIKE